MIGFEGWVSIREESLVSGSRSWVNGSNLQAKMDSIMERTTTFGREFELGLDLWSVRYPQV